MEDSVYNDDVTIRSLIHHASQEIPKYSTPVPVLQPSKPASKKSTKRSRSALTAHNATEDFNISPRTLIGSTCREKLNRKSSAYFPTDEILQPNRRRSRRSLHAPTDEYDDISVDENEETITRTALPDVADISAIAGGNKKQKLQLGKLDNRVYSKITETKKKRSQAVRQSSPEEEYDGSFWNDELSSSFQQDSRAASVRTRGNVSCARSDHSHSDSTSNVNLNTKAVEGSPLAEKQKPFTEKSIPHLSSDSDATLLGFPGEMDGRRKSRTSAIPKVATNALSVTHPLCSSGTRTSSGKHSTNNLSPSKIVPNILPQTLYSERQHLSPVSSQTAQTSKFARVSKHGQLSDGSDDADESSNDDEEVVNNNQNILLQDIGEPVEMLETTSRRKSVSRRDTSPSSSKPKPSRSVSRDHHVNVEEQQEEEEGIEDENLATSNDIIQFVEVSKTTTASPTPQKSSSAKLSELPKKSMASGSESPNIVSQASLVSEDVECQQEQRISTRKTPRKTPTSSRKVQNVSSKNLSASVPHNSAKLSSASLPYNIVSHESKDKSDVSHITMGSDMEESETDKNEPAFEGIAQGLEPSESVSSHQQRSTSRASSGVVQSSSSSYKIVNPPGINMYASPRIAEDASYQLPHQTKTRNTAARESVNVSKRTSNSSKASEVGHLTSPTLYNTESSVSDPISRKMHSTAIHDDNVMMMETIQENSPADMSSEVPHQSRVFRRRKISHIPKASELRKSSLSNRSHISDSMTENDTAVQGNTYQIPPQNDAVVQGNTYQISPQNISGKKSVSNSRRGKHTRQLSDREQSVSPVPPTISKASGTARKSVHSSATSDHNVALEDALLQQQTEEPNRRSRRSVVISKKGGHSTDVYDQENSPEASPVRSRVSSTTKKSMYSGAMPHHSAAVEDTSQQADTSARKAVGTSRKGRHSKQLSDQENSPCPASPVRPRVSESTRKSMHSAAAVDSVYRILEPRRMTDQQPTGTSSEHRHGTQVFDQKQSESPMSPVRSRVSWAAKKRMHSNATPDQNATKEDGLNQVSQQNEVSGRKSVDSSRKDRQSAQEQSVSQTSRTGSRISRTARMSMHSAATPDHNGEAEEEARNQVIQQTEVLSTKSIPISRKDRLSAQVSEREQSTSPASPSRPRISGTARKSMRSSRTPSYNAAAEGTISQGASRRETRSAQLSDQEQPGTSESPVRSRISGSSRKRMHSAVAFDSDAVTEPLVPGESSSEKPNQTVIHHSKTIDTSSKSRPSTKTPPRHILASSVQSSILDSIRNKKMHSIAISDHDTPMKTVQNRSVSPMKTKETVVTGRSRTKPTPAVHTDSDEEAAERLSVASSVESDQSPERVHERDLPLPPTVQNHDQVAAESEDRVPAARVSRQRKKTTPPRISSVETKSIVEHFAGMKLSRGALNSIMESTDFFWQKTFEIVETYAKHANRNTIEVQDVELLLYRQRHADDRNSMNALITRYMPMDLRRQVIPMATPGNILIP